MLGALRRQVFCFGFGQNSGLEDGFEHFGISLACPTRHTWFAHPFEKFLRDRKHLRVHRFRRSIRMLQAIEGQVRITLIVREFEEREWRVLVSARSLECGRSAFLDEKLDEVASILFGCLFQKAFYGERVFHVGTFRNRLGGLGVR